MFNDDAKAKHGIHDASKFRVRAAGETLHFISGMDPNRKIMRMEVDPGDSVTLKSATDPEICVSARVVSATNGTFTGIIEDFGNRDLVQHDGMEIGDTVAFERSNVVGCGKE